MRPRPASPLPSRPRPSLPYPAQPSPVQCQPFAPTANVLLRPMSHSPVRHISTRALASEIFGRSLATMNPFDGLSDDDIRTAICNANGTRLSLFVPEISFDLLVRRQIARLEQPGLQVSLPSNMPSLAPAFLPVAFL